MDRVFKDTNNKIPLFSVIVPTYKISEVNLRKCLDSLLHNSQDAEIILVDDNGNLDLCGKIIDEYAKKYYNILAIHQSNQGVSVARNAGMSIAQGDYLIFVDPDDWVTKNFYSQMKNAVSKYNTSDIIIFAAIVDYNGNQFRNNFWNASRSFTGKEKDDLELQLIAKGATSYFPTEIGVGVPWAKIYRKEFVQDNNLEFKPELRRMQDNIFNMYAFELANEIVYIDEPIYYYRKSMDSATNKKNEKVIYYFELVNDEVVKFIKKFKKPEIFEAALHIKRLIGVNSYYKLYFQFASSANEKKRMRQEFRELLEKKEYADSLNKVNEMYLFPKEKVFINILKLKNLRLFSFLQMLEQCLMRLKNRRF
ncbi:glycosyltransferase [Streptococcus infantis]|uniref:glycosyltransferase n=1 Tax=Streptococcus infantis TaxID=68892 RepID=UPI001CBC6E9A|nr:glycosyltransferase [Streptococcus infantis]MBZ2110414.1 glycosyltransferase [Streptococcus infantis]MBZ2113007.1 glycosyltransferase [Streptococcus infantis]MBZ2117666.1 glycosyltransferase [Streptococcus infantis]